MISPYHPELYTWLRVVKIRLAQLVNFRLTFREELYNRKRTAKGQGPSQIYSVIGARVSLGLQWRICQKDLT